MSEDYIKKIRIREQAELIKRLRKHPVICMDKQNVTSDAADELEHQQAKVDALTKAITDFREGNYSDPRSYRPNDCPHGAHYWQECGNCDEEYWQSALKQEVSDD